MTGLLGQKVADFALVTHQPASLVILEMKGKSYSVSDVRDKLENVANAMTTGLPSHRLLPAVFALRHDSMSTRMWKRYLVRVGAAEMKVQTRHCGAAAESLDGSLLEPA